MDSNVTAPAISVIMPVYNAGRYLNEAIDSILKQSFTDFEFFIIDDASTDNSTAIIKLYSDKRIRFIQKPVNSGYTDSLNMAIKLAKGKYVARMDADDIAYEERFQKQYEYMEKHQDVLVLGTAYKIIGTDTTVQLPLTTEEAKVVAIMQVPVAHPTVLIKRDIFTKYKLGYNKKYEPAEDYDLWTRILDVGKIENLPDVLLMYRRHQEQESITKYNRLVEAAVGIRNTQLKKLLSFKDKPYDVLFAISILTKENISLSSHSIRKIALLLTDMYRSNKIKMVYDDNLLYKYLREAWLFYIYNLDKPRIKDINLLFKIKSSPVTKMNFIFILSFLKKIGKSYISLPRLYKRSFQKAIK